MSAKLEWTISRTIVCNQFDLQLTDSTNYCRGSFNANSR
jgi:hypothetical protein